MTSPYAPEIVPSDLNDPLKLQAFLDRELRNISKAMDRAQTVTLDPQFVLPPKPEEGVIYYADGTSWNPGSGEGYYGYVNGAFVKLDNSFGAGGLIIPGATNPTPTIEGDARWDTDDNVLVIGDGAGQTIYRQQLWEKIGLPIVVTNVANIIWTNLSAYRSLRITGRIIPLTAGSNLQGMVSEDNGATYRTAVNDYFYVEAQATSAPAVAGASAFSVAGSGMFLVGGAPSTTVGAKFVLEIDDFNQANSAQGVLQSVTISNAGAHLANIWGWSFQRGVARDAFKIQASAGNITGYATLEGIRG